MKRATPSRRLVTALLATIALAVGASPLAAADQSGSPAGKNTPRHVCPPLC